MAKTLRQLSAQELFDLARQREQEEQEQMREAMRAEIETLKEQRRELINNHKKELAALDRKIRELGGSTRKARTTRTRGALSAKIIEIIGKAGKISTEALKEKLAAAGMEPKNLNQQLNYLKRRGQIASAGRAVYKLA